MLKQIFLCLLVVNIVIVFLNKKSKIVTGLTLLGTFLIFGGNTLSVDYPGYKRAFDKLEYDEFEAGYVLFCTLLRRLGFTYQSVVIFIEVIMLILIIWIVRKINGNYHIFFSAFLVFEQFMGIVQTRAFIAAVLLTVATIYLKQAERKKAILIMLFATTFHRSIGVFLPFFILYGCKIKIKKFLWYITGISTITLFLVIGINLTTGINLLTSFVYSVLKITGTLEKASVYSETTRLGALLYGTFYFANLFCIMFIQKKYKSDISKGSNDYGNLMLALNLYASLFLPFLVVSTIFYRFYRMLNIANYAYLCSVINKQSKHNFVGISIKKMESIACLMINCFLWGALHLYYSPNIYRLVFENNMFIQ